MVTMKMTSDSDGRALEVIGKMHGENLVVALWY